MTFETLASGYGLVEAPRVDDQNRLYFSDIQNGGVFRRSPDGNIESLIPEREKTGVLKNLFSSWQGKPPAAFNDLQPDDHGSIYTGSVDFDNLVRRGKPTPGDLFRIDPSGEVTKLWEGIEVTNGLGFSPDRKLLYHCDSNTAAVWVYDVKADRSVADRRVFAKLSSGFPDGMAVDAEGGVWVAAYLAGEVVRFKSDSTLDRKIKVPARAVASLTFGGPDLQDLYIVTADNADNKDLKGTIFRTRSDIPGLPVPKSRF